MMQLQEAKRFNIPIIVIGDGSYAAKSLLSPAEQALGPNDYYINLGPDYKNLNQEELTILVERLKKTGSAVTAEFENVPVELLKFFKNQ